MEFVDKSHNFLIASDEVIITNLILNNTSVSEYFMIISHKLKIIFIRSMKVSGSSFQRALLGYCGNDDVVGEEVTKFTNYFNGRYFKDGHISSEELRDQLPKNIWDNYLKVSIIRCIKRGYTRELENPAMFQR